MCSVLDCIHFSFTQTLQKSLWNKQIKPRFFAHKTYNVFPFNNFVGRDDLSIACNDSK